MTNILAIPLVQITATVGSDEDWIDAISFTDSNNVPIDLTGITITLDISTGVTTTLTASTANGFLSFVEAAGSSVNNVLLINVPAASKTALTGELCAFRDSECRRSSDRHHYGITHDQAILLMITSLKVYPRIAMTIVRAAAAVPSLLPQDRKSVV